MSQLFLHLGREKIILQGDGFSSELVYLDIERKLPVSLIETIEKYTISSVWVVHGPGSFTTLRLGCLILNTIKQFGDNQDLKIYSCSKLDIYRHAHQQGLLPEVGYVFIGQKKNMWKITADPQGTNHVYWQEKIISYENKEIDIDTGGDYFIDPCEHILLEYLERDHMVKYEFDGTQLQLSYAGSHILLSSQDMGLEEVDILEPNYMMDPQLG